MKVSIVTQFTSLGLEERLLKALAHQGYETPTPIQEQAIPHVLAGKDLLGIAQTGTGKTASFALPILQRLMEHPRTPASRSARTLILSPTRELAAQIADSFRDYGRFLKVSVTTVFGGVSEGPQRQSMQGGVDILVATPGRLLDLVSQRAVDLTKTEIFVLDEADRMLDMGFINDIRKLVRYLPAERQNLFFSATMPQEIGKLAGELLRNPVHVSVTPQATTVERIAQRVIHVGNGDKRALLVHLLRSDTAMSRVLVFTRTKHGADKIVRALDAAGIYSSALHGNKSQSQRVSTLNAFRAGRAPVLVATDLAARGIDVDGITHVVNFDLPHVPESYVHRIGRTARAGAEGIAIAFCDREERSLLRDIEKVTRQQIPASEWQADRTTALPPVPVLTHDQKQDFRRQRENDRQPSEDARPHRGRPGGGRPQQARGDFDRPRPQRTEGGADRPRRDFNGPRPERAAAGADRPRRDFNGPRPERAAGGADRPRRDFNGPRPERAAGGADRPRRDFNGPRPERAEGGADRPRRDFNGPRPERAAGGAERGPRRDDAAGPRQPRGDKPHFAKSRDERRPFGKPDRGPRPHQGGDRMEQAGPRPHVTVEPLSRDGRDRPRPPQHRADGERQGKPHFGKPGQGGKPRFGDKPRSGDKPAFGAKPAQGGKPGAGRPYRGKTTTSAGGNDGNRPHRRAF